MPTISTVIQRINRQVRLKLMDGAARCRMSRTANPLFPKRARAQGDFEHPTRQIPTPLTSDFAVVIQCVENFPAKTRGSWLRFVRIALNSINTSFL